MTETEWLYLFGRNLTQMIYSYGMTQKELADATGLSTASINAYINGRKMPGVKALINISYVLNCTIDELVDFGEKVR